MNKLFAIAVLFGLISGQEIFEPTVNSVNEESAGLNIDPSSIHHGNERKAIEDVLARKDENSKKKHGLFNRKRDNAQKGKKGALGKGMGGILRQAKQQGAKKGMAGRKLQKQNAVTKMKNAHLAKKAMIDAKKHGFESGQQEKIASAKKAEKAKKMQFIKEQRLAVLSKKFKLTPEGAIMKDAEGKPIKND